MNRVPLPVEQTGNEAVDRNLYNVAQAVRSLQEQAAPPENVSTATAFLVARQATVTITSDAIKPVVVSLPNTPPQNQTTKIVNQSNYPASVRTADARTVFDDVAPGASRDFIANGVIWRAA